MKIRLYFVHIYTTMLESLHFFAKVSKKLNKKRLNFCFQPPLFSLGLYVSYSPIRSILLLEQEKKQPTAALSCLLHD